jgi:hypothetical protein
VRKLDRPSYRDQQAIRPVFSPQPGVDFVAPWKAPAIGYLLPMSQHTPDQPPLFPHSFDPPCGKGIKRHSLFEVWLNIDKWDTGPLRSQLPRGY